MKKKRNKINKPRTSKMIMWLFIILLGYVIIKGVNYDFSNLTYIDTAIFCSCIATVGGITGAIVTKYLNNSNAENIPKIQIGLYKEAMNIRLYYNEQMLKLQKEYGVTKEDTDNLESDFKLDEIADEIFNKTVSELDEKVTQSHEDVEIQHYN